MTPLAFTIPVAPRTKKNHGRRIRRGGKILTIPSEAYERYEADSIAHILERHPRVARARIAEPVNVKATFYCDAARRVDLNGLNQALHDMLVKAGVLADDCAVNPPIVVGTDGTRVAVDRKNPRTEVTITPLQI